MKVCRLIARVVLGTITLAVSSGVLSAREAASAGPFGEGAAQPPLLTGGGGFMGAHITVPAGTRFGRLTVLPGEEVRRGRILWLRVRCECGATTLVPKNSARYGLTRSCGCLVRDTTAALTLTHGNDRRGHRSPEYSSWVAMKARCYRQTNDNYRFYGGRGITVCRRWLGSFADFLADMGPRPSGAVLDRIESNGNYEPGNCRWSSGREQVMNRRDVKPLTHNGRTLTMTEWERACGIKADTIRWRLKHGWSPEDATSRVAQRCGDRGRA